MGRRILAGAEERAMLVSKPDLEQAFPGEAPGIFGGPVRVGVDGGFITLPAGSGAIEVGARP